MEKRIVFYWQELNQKYTPEQVFFILTYWTVAEYSCEMCDVVFPGSMEEWRTCLLRAFQNCMDYDIKETAVRMSDRIEWFSLVKDVLSERILTSYVMELREYLYSREGNIQDKLCSLMDILFDLAAINTSYQTTPRSIREIVAKLFAQNHISNMVDICCGSGGFGLAVWRKLNEREEVSYCGMNMELSMCDINRLMTYICGVRNSEVIWKDILEHHVSKQDKKFDLVLLDVPRGQNKNIAAIENIDWVKDIGQKSIFVDWIYILKAVDAMDKKGKGVVIVTSGSLARQNESLIRKKIIENDWIEAVITLPVNLYPNARTGSEMIIFNKNKSKQRTKKIIFIDISKYHYRDNRNYFSISDEGMDIIWETYEEYCSIPGISSVIPVSQIEQESWSLKPMRYIGEQKFQSDDSTLALKDIAQITRGVQLKKEEEERLSEYGTALLLNIKDIQEGNIQYENAGKISPKSYNWHSKFQIQENDIIITSKGTNFKIAIVEENPPEAYICGNLTLLRVDQNMYHPYVLLEYLTSTRGMRALESIQSGTTIRILNNTNMERLEIPTYPQEVMNSIGEQLKNKRKKFKQQMKNITEQYELERKVLLEMLKINE